MPANNEFIKESTILRTLTMPFRSMRIIIFAIVILFGTSLFLQTYFHKPEILNDELVMAQKIGITKNLTQQVKQNKTPINITITRYTYKGLYWTFFQALRLEKMPESHRFYDAVQHLHSTLKIISLRIGNAAIYIFYSLLLGIIALIDGLNARKIRQANAGRESSSLYHRAKYLRTGILFSSIFLYLTLPFAINPQWLMLPVIGIALSIFMQAKYLKKYL